VSTKQLDSLKNLIDEHEAEGWGAWNGFSEYTSLFIIRYFPQYEIPIRMWHAAKYGEPDDSSLP
jgi:hypothetical protein